MRRCLLELTERLKITNFEKLKWLCLPIKLGKCQLLRNSENTNEWASLKKCLPFLEHFRINVDI